jgi:hypothetical protein
MALCDKIVFEGQKVGTHFAWHVLNALALFLLLRASLEDSPASVRQPRGTARLREADAEPPLVITGTRAPAPKPLAEGVASAAEDAAKKGASADDAPKPKLLFPA